MSYTNYTNGQQTNSQADVWANQQRVKLIRFSKVKPDGTRGVLIENEQGEQRWLNMESSTFFLGIQWGQWCYYYGHGAKPILGTIPIESKTPDARGLINQQQADYYARIAEQNKRDIQPEPIQFNQSSQVASNEVADDQLIEDLSFTMSKCVAMSQELNPSLDEDNQTKIAISVFIQYQKQKSEMPY